MNENYYIDETWPGLLLNADRRAGATETMYGLNNPDLYGVIVESAHVSIECYLKSYVLKNIGYPKKTHDFGDLREAHPEINGLLLSFQKTLREEEQKLLSIIIGDSQFSTPSRRYDSHPNKDLTDSYYNLLKIFKKWIKEKHLKI